LRDILRKSCLEQKSAELSGLIYADLEKTGQTIGLADVLIAAKFNMAIAKLGKLSSYSNFNVLVPHFCFYIPFFLCDFAPLRETLK
jgi:hypothetical protein